MTIKGTLWLASMALLSLTVHAQHFDWAKGYGSSQEGCMIKGSVTDADGNLYILGQFTKDATWDGQRILPITPYGPGQNSINTLIAKISPSGEMLWKKVIHSNNNSNSIPYDIKPIGDTAFACLIQMCVPSDNNYTYFIDTLLTTWSDYPTEGWGMENKVRTAFILIGFDGNVKEQHFLNITYTDTVGNDIVEYYGSEPWYKGTGLYNPSFDIDNVGNVYICREAQDYLDPSRNTQIGTLKSIKIWCDCRVIGEFDIPEGTQYWFPQLLKFSPHFVTLLANRYIVQKSDSIYYETITSNTKIDASGNVYCLRNQDVQGISTNNTIVIDSVHGISFSLSEINRSISYLVQLSSNLDVNWKITLDDSTTLNSNAVSMTLFHDISFDNDSSLLFLSATTSRGIEFDTMNFCSVLKYLETPLSLKNVHFFISFSLNEETPALHSYGSIPSKFRSSGHTYAKDNLACKNNRLFLQSLYQGGTRFPGNDIQFNHQNDIGLGLCVFDYQGNVISGIDYAALSPYNRPGSISLQDSLLYLSGILKSDATFGDVQIPEQGRFAYIAKYIDSSLMIPYISPHLSIINDSKESHFVIYPNPVHDVLFFSDMGESIVEMSIISIQGSKKNVIPHNSVISVSDFLPGMYILEIITKENKYHQKIIKQ